MSGKVEPVEFAANNGNSPQSWTIWYSTLAAPLNPADVRKEHRAILLGLPLAILALNLYAPAQPDLLERLLASLLIIVAFVPAWRWRSGSDVSTPLLPLVALLYGIYCSLPIFTLPLYSVARDPYENMPSSDVEYALALSILGMVAMFAGYYSRPTKAVARSIPKVALGWRQPRTVLHVGVALAFTGFVVRVFAYRYFVFNTNPYWAINGQVQQLFGLLVQTAFIGLTILYVMHLCGYLSPMLTRFMNIILIPFLILFGISTGTITQALNVVLLLVFIYAMFNRRLPWKVMALGLAAITILQPAKTLFRMMDHGDAKSLNDGIMERVEDFLSISLDVIAGRATLEMDPVTFSAHRLNLVTMFAEVVDKTPSTIPFWYGHTYYPLLTKPIPRLLYPDKRPDDAGQSFPHRYEMLSDNDSTTSVKLFQLIEAYVNFGVPGIIIIMFIIGAIYRLVEAMFVHGSMGIGDVVCLTCVVTPWLDIEANFSLTFGGFFDEVIFIAIIGVVVAMLGTVLG